MGRIDHQVKIRGFRIELGEIEAVSAKHEQIKEVVVIAREDKPGEKSLAAYIVLDQEKEINISELREFLRKKLPDYMIPSAFVILDALPLTPNGKIDRKALPAPDLDLMREQEFVAPRNETEKTISEIWKKILNIEKISVNDNFFEVGGNSLLTVRLVSQIEQSFGKTLTVAKMFEYPTIEQLGQILDKRDEETHFTPLVKIQPQGKKTPIFLLHPGDGQVFCYTDFVKQFDKTQPLYGLQAYGLEANTTPLSMVDEMATNYIEAIHSVQSADPYILVGYCYGGLLAYEIARQLKKNNEVIGLLALIDTVPPYINSHFFDSLDDVETFIGFIINLVSCDFLFRAINQA